MIFDVMIYHFILNHWAPADFAREGSFPCGNLKCSLLSSSNLSFLEETAIKGSHDSKISVGLYNIHSLWEIKRHYLPNYCVFDLTMAESEESYVRYKSLFHPSFKNFHGFTTTHPSSTIQRVYNEAFLNSTNFHNLTSFPNLIKAATYVASDCHRRDSANSHRDQIVQQIRENGFRVDGLGRCMKSIGPEGHQLPNTHNTRSNLLVKRNVIGKYLFHLAFENSIEEGYVTEKPFDALLAGQ
jgi:hypothetical protein